MSRSNHIRGVEGRQITEERIKVKVLLRGFWSGWLCQLLIKDKYGNVTLLTVLFNTV